MIKTIIVEDEAYIRKGLTTLIDSLDKGISIIGECASVQEAVTVVKACKPDLIFLDIHLPDGNAFDFLTQTDQMEYKVIFVTAYDEYALQALKKGAIDYILKPVDLEELDNAIDKVISASSLTHQNPIQKFKELLFNDRLVVSLSDGYQVINFNELQYCKSDKGYTTFHLTDYKKVIASKPTKYFVDQLPASRFARTHQSCIVNLSFIERYDRNGIIILKDGHQIPVSISKKEEFLNKLLNRDQS